MAIDDRRITSSNSTHWTRSTAARSSWRPPPRAAAGGSPRPQRLTPSAVDPDAIACYFVANDKGGWQADVPALRKLHPDLMTFETWLTREGTAKFARAAQ